MEYQQIIEKIQLAKNSEEVTAILTEVREANKLDDTNIKILQDKISQMLSNYSPGNNYGFQPSTVMVEGIPLSLGKAETNLKFAFEWIKHSMQSKMTTMNLKEADLPDFLTDDELSRMLNYTKSTISSKRSRCELPQTNSFRLTSKAELFKLMSSTTPSYLTPDEKVQQLINKRKKK